MPSNILEEANDDEFEVTREQMEKIRSKLFVKAPSSMDATSPLSAGVGERRVLTSPDFNAPTRSPASMTTVGVQKLSRSSRPVPERLAPSSKVEAVGGAKRSALLSPLVDASPKLPEVERVERDLVNMSAFDPRRIARPAVPDEKERKVTVLPPTDPKSLSERLALMRKRSSEATRLARNPTIPKESFVSVVSSEQNGAAEGAFFLHINGINSLKGIIRHRSKFVGTCCKLGGNSAWQKRYFSIDQGYFVCFKPQNYDVNNPKTESFVGMCPMGLTLEIPNEENTKFYVRQPKWVIPVQNINGIYVLSTYSTARSDVAPPSHSQQASEKNAFPRIGTSRVFGQLFKFPSNRQLAQMAKCVKTVPALDENVFWMEIFEAFAAKGKISLDEMRGIFASVVKDIFMITTDDGSFYILKANDQPEAFLWVTILCAKKILFKDLAEA